MRSSKPIVLGVAALLLLAALAYGWSMLRSRRAKAALEVRYDRLRRAGMPLRCADLEPREIGPEDDAAPLYRAAFAALPELTDRERDALAVVGGTNAGGGTDARGRMNAAEARGLAEKALEAADAALALASRAAAMPECRFNLDREAGFSMDLDPEGRDEPLRRITLLLHARAALRAAAGRVADALADAHTLLDLHWIHDEEPALVFQLTRMARIDAGLQALRGILDVAAWPDDVALDRWREDLDAILELQAAREAFVAERAMIIDTAENMMRTGAATFEAPALGVRVRMSSPSAVREDLVLYLDKMDRVIDLAGEPYPRALAGLAEHGLLAEPDAGAVEAHPLSIMMFPNTGMILRRQAATRTRADAARAALALIAWKRERGRFPDTLEDLVPARLDAAPRNHVTGEPIAYVLDEGAARLDPGPDRPEGAGRPQKPPRVWRLR